MSDPTTNQTSIQADRISVWSDEVKGYVEIGTNKANAVDVYSKVATDALLLTKADSLNPSFTGSVSGVTKAHVGLAQADNTSDASKPVSTATQAELDLKAAIADVYSKAAADTLLASKAPIESPDRKSVV